MRGVDRRQAKLRMVEISADELQAGSVKVLELPGGPKWRRIGQAVLSRLPCYYLTANLWLAHCTL